MKKIFSFALVALTVMVTFISCRDDEIAEDLAGIWEGEVAQAFFVGRYTYEVDFQRVDIEFYKNPYRFAKGDGIEYDYSGYDRYNNCYYYYACGFVYEVRNGNIYIDYDDGTRVVIRDYSLSGSRFRGTFRNYYGGGYLADFDFVRVGGYYYNTYSANWRRRTRSGEETGEEPKMIEDKSFEAAHQRAMQKKAQE
jgi:hypothetical protein